MASQAQDDQLARLSRARALAVHGIHEKPHLGALGLVGAAQHPQALGLGPAPGMKRQNEEHVRRALLHGRVPAVQELHKWLDGIAVLQNLQGVLSRQAGEKHRRPLLGSRPRWEAGEKL